MRIGSGADWQSARLHRDGADGGTGWVRDLTARSAGVAVEQMRLRFVYVDADRADDSVAADDA